jgi:hypothetical protein
MVVNDFPRQARDKHELNVAFFSVRRFWAHLGSGEAAAHRRSDVRGQHRPRRFGAAGSRLPRLDLRAEPFPLGAREHERFLSRRVVPYRGACGVPRYVLRIAQQSPKFCTFCHCFQGRFCKSPLFRVTFNGKLGDYYAVRSKITEVLRHSMRKTKHLPRQARDKYREKTFQLIKK